ncbi:MAG: MoxR family ATPase [Proteobacteria bacterium]|nr:MoxR family ATPase [Pseudomonadota bacterium]
MAPAPGLPATVDETLALLAAGGYVAERSLGVALFLALNRQRPLFLEGEAGVGKTELAKVVAAALGRRLVRLQCYDGLDVSQAVYEWNYPRQMVEIRLAEAAGGTDRTALERDIFSERFLIRRPLLQALDVRPETDPNGPPVLLIDELDRADEPFEAFLLEALAEYQVTIPELGVIRAAQPPIVILTSNRTREIHDALKRRCFYHWLDYPSAERERQILALKAPEASAALAGQVVVVMQRLRALDLYKAPGVAEAIDWAAALVALGRDALDAVTLDETLGVILKYQDDIAAVRGEPAARIMAEAATQPQAGAASATRRA